MANQEKKSVFFKPFSPFVIGLIGLLGLVTSQNSYAFREYIAPYVGIDYKQLWTDGTWQFRHFIPKSFPGGAVYIGAKFTESMGLELGYNRSVFRHRTRVTPTTVTKVGTRFTSFSYDLNFYIPVEDCWELIVSLGMETMKSHVVVSGFLPTGSTGFTTKKGIGRVGFGSHYLLTEFLGVRFIGRWENTSALRQNGNKFVKDAIGGSVGFFVRF